MVKPSDEETYAESAETTERYLIVPYVHRSSEYVCSPGVDDTLKERTLSFVLSDERLNIYKYLGPYLWRKLPHAIALRTLTEIDEFQPEN